MKKKILLIFSSLVILSSIITACTGYNNPPTSTEAPPQSTENSSEIKLKELEAQLATIIQSQSLSETKRKEEIAALKAEIEKLKAEVPKETQPPTETLPPSTEAPPAPIKTFTYTIENGKAVITKITAEAESITIPSSLDGYPVYSIGSEAISSGTIKTVVISMGVEKLDWFAFDGCTSLYSVTIPASVSSIGYGAFDNTSKALTIKCAKNSFAHKYAESYGINYSLTD